MLKGVISRIVFVALLMVSHVGWGQESAEESNQAHLDFGAAVEQFRTAVVSDALSAFERVAVSEVSQRVEHWGAVIWDGIPAKVGWSYFFSTSPYTLGSTGGSTPISSFYHPWSDVFLLLEWQVKEGRFQINDVELVNGDWMRGNKEGVQPIPLWRRGNLFRPEALSLSVAESFAALEDEISFRGKVNLKALLHYRSRPDLVAINESAVRLRLLDALIPVSQWRSPEEAGTEWLAPVRKRTQETIALLEKGDVEKAIETASETSAETKAAMGAMPVEMVQSLNVVQIRQGSDWFMVFLVPENVPTGFLSLIYRKTEAGEQLRRVDLVNYQKVLLDTVNLPVAEGSGEAQ